VEFTFRFDDTFTIVGIDDENKSLGVLEVVAPQWTDLVLTSDIPHGKADVFVLYGLDVEADGWNGGDNFTELEFVENCSLTGRIKTD
jgi:hypothetical protein